MQKAIMDLSRPENIIHALSMAKKHPILGPLLNLWIVVNFLVAIFVTWKIIRSFLCRIWPDFDKFLDQFREKKKLQITKYLSQIRVALFAITLEIYGKLDRESEKAIRRKSALKWLKRWKKAENERLEKYRRRTVTLPSMLDTSNGGSLPEIFEELAGPPVNIICFDGGGVKGFTILDIFTELEKRMSIPLVSLFDLAAGTAVGGVAALVGNKFPEKGKAVKHAEFMMRTILDGSMSKTSMSTLLAKGELCEDNRAAVFKHGFGDDTPMQNNRRLKAFAVAAIEKDSQKDEESEVAPFLMRTYDKPEKHPNAPLADGTSSIKMWEAAEATTAAPLLWKRTEVMIPACDEDNKTMKKVELCHGGIVANDPTELAVYEAMALFPGRPIGLVVSIGCGHSQGNKEKVTSDLCRPDIQAMVEAMGGDYVRLNPYIGDVSTIESRGHALKDMRAKVRKYMTKSFDVIRAHRLMKKCFKLRKRSSLDHDGSVSSAGFTGNWDSASARFSTFDDDMDVSVLSMNDWTLPKSPQNFFQESAIPEDSERDDKSLQSLKISDIERSEHKGSVGPTMTSPFMESNDTLMESPKSSIREESLRQYDLKEAAASLPSIASVATATSTASKEDYPTESPKPMEPLEEKFDTNQRSKIPCVISVDSGEQSSCGRMYDRIAARSIAVIDTFDGPSLIKLLGCFVQKGHYDRELMDAIAWRSREVMETFDADGLVALAKMYRQMNHSDPDLFDAIANASVAIIDTFDAQALLGIGSSFVARDKGLTRVAG